MFCQPKVLANLEFLALSSSKYVSVVRFEIFILFFSQGDNLILNSSCGYLLRVKDCSVSEGGVAAGFAHLGILDVELD